MIEALQYFSSIYVRMPWVLMAMGLTGVFTFVIMYNGDRWWGGKK